MNDKKQTPHARTHKRLAKLRSELDAVKASLVMSDEMISDLCDAGVTHAQGSVLLGEVLKEAMEAQRRLAVAAVLPWPLSALALGFMAVKNRGKK